MVVVAAFATGLSGELAARFARSRMHALPRVRSFLPSLPGLAELTTALVAPAAAGSCC